MADDDDQIGCVGFLLLALGGLFLWLTWPVWTILAATVGAWWLVRKREDWWGKASASILGSTSFGVATVCALLFVFNAFKRTLEPQWLYRLESALVTLRITLREWTDLSLPVFVAVVVGLVGLSYLLPQLKPVSRFFAVRTTSYKIVVALIAATSFSFFSQVPLERFAVDAHERLATEHRWRIERYRVLLREEWSEVGRYLAAEYLEDLTVQLDDADHAAYQELFSHIHEVARQETLANDAFGLRDIQLDRNFERARRRPDASSVAERVARRFATRHYQAATKDGRVEPAGVDAWVEQRMSAIASTARDLENKPATGWEWQRYKDLAATHERRIIDQEKATETAKLRAEERVTALKESFVELVTRGIPVIEGLAGEYVTELASKFSEYVADEVIRRSAGEPAKKSPVEVVKEVGQTLAVMRLEVMSRAVRIGSGADVVREEAMVIIRSEVKVEVAREVERVKLEREVTRRQTETMREAARARGKGGRAPRGR